MSEQMGLGSFGRDQAGLTLLETLIALTILSMVSVMIWQSIHFSAQFRAKTDQRSELVTDSSALQALRPILRTIVAPDVSGDEPDLAFRLEPGHLEFTTASIYADHWSRLSRLRITAEQSEGCAGQVALVMAWREVAPGQVTNSSWDRGRVIMDCAQSVEISARGKDESGEQIQSDTWIEEWLPEILEIHVEKNQSKHVVSVALVYGKGVM